MPITGSLPSSPSRIEYEHSVAPRRAPSWLAVLLLLNAVAVGALSTTRPHDSNWTAAIYALIGGAPFIAVGILVRSRPRPFSYGALVGAQLFAALSVGLLLTAMALGWSDSPSAATAMAGGRAVVLGVAIAEVAGLLWAVSAIRAWDGAGAVREARNGFLAISVWPFVAGVLAAQVGSGGEVALRRSAERDRDALTRNLVRIQGCAIQYAAQNPDVGYPAGLAAIGPGGSKCLEHDEVAATHDRYTVSYHPEPVDRDGRIPSFVVRGVTRSNAESGSLRMWADSSGTQRRSIGVAIDERTIRPGDSIPQRLAGVRACVEAMRADGHLPATIHELSLALRDNVVNERFAERGCASGSVYEIEDSASVGAFAQLTGFRFAYMPLADGYRIDARPAEFGRTALRNYTVADDGAVHFTRSDRVATLDDPALPQCTPYDDGDCTPTLLSMPPQAQFIYPASVPFDGTYRLRIRVVGDSARLPVGLTWSFECNVQPSGPAEPEMPRPMPNPTPELSCGRPREAKPAVVDSIAVRLWLRNGAGLTTHTDGMIRIEKTSPGPEAPPTANSPRREPVVAGTLPGGEA